MRKHSNLRFLSEKITFTLGFSFGQRPSENLQTFGGRIFYEIIVIFLILLKMFPEKSTLFKPYMTTFFVFQCIFIKNYT